LPQTGGIFISAICIRLKIQKNQIVNTFLIYLPQDSHRFGAEIQNEI